MYDYNTKSSNDEDDHVDDTVLEIINNIVC